MLYKKEYGYTIGTLPSTLTKIIKYYYCSTWKDQPIKVAIVVSSDDEKRSII
ncbi:MAG: hypothetical protein K0Q49_1521 [Haloplasmataceae bacterium]|jgi:hypothetical protein|nr:hypothetical protein [Haloplasmataceae bacterium]